MHYSNIYSKRHRSGFPQIKAAALRTGELSAMFDAPLPEMLTVMCVCNKAQFADDDNKGKANVMQPKFHNVQEKDK